MSNSRRKYDAGFKRNAVMLVELHLQRTTSRSVLFLQTQKNQMDRYSLREIGDYFLGNGHSRFMSHLVAVIEKHA
ncbi:hypothetical protein [Desulfovibrio inopinatus]|uniref:hypothetical protein n=1 Tax=Desulfovibrio inopinatus TaxID=102109 RepID=UPI000480B42A|nr:hypothetical protein [Desulfovibrio inopinatus]